MHLSVLTFSYDECPGQFDGWRLYREDDIVHNLDQVYSLFPG